MKKQVLSRHTILVCFAVCALLAFITFGKQVTPLVTTWDVYGYYVYLPGVFTFGDLDTFAFAEDHFAAYPISSGLYQLAHVGQNRVPIYTSGLAIIWSPFYLLAQGAAWIGPWAQDGLSSPYQWALILAALVFGFFGFWCLRKVLSRYFGDGVVALVLIVLLFGTNYFNYICFEPGMPHTYLFAGHAFLLLCVDNWFRSPQLRYIAFGTLCLVLMCLIRPTEIVALLLPVSYAFVQRARLPERQVIGRQMLISLGIGCLIVLPQLLLWKANTGSWIYNAYTEAGHVFHFDGRHVLDGLFSYRKGWLVYTPVMILALAGLVLLRNESKRWKWPVVALVIAHIWVTFSWHMWYYASSFGSRPMIHVYPELALGLAALVAWLSRKWWMKMTIILLLAVCIVLNLFQTWQYQNDVLPKDHTTKQIYWSIFGKNQLDRGELISIDVPHRLRDKEEHVRSPLGKIEVEVPSDLSDSTRFGMIGGRPCQVLVPGMEYSETLTLQLDSGQAQRLQGAWIDNLATLYTSGEKFSLDHTANMVFEVTRGGESRAWHAVRFQLFTEPDTWREVIWEYKMPEDLRAGDLLKLYIWNQSPDSIAVHSLEISWLKHPRQSSQG